MRTVPRRSTSIRRAAGMFLPLLSVAGCVLPYRMEPATPVASYCPGEVAPRVEERGMAPDDVRWYRASEPRDRELSAQWCATVGEPVVELSPRAALAEWAPGAALEVVSWNTWIGGGDLFRMLDEELGLECASEQSPDPVAVEPFVLLLQEVWRYSDDLPEVRGSRIIPETIDPRRPPGDHSDIVEVARRCGLALVYVPSARNGPDSGSRPKEDKGNAILSNVPLVDPIAIDLPLEGGRKVAVAATVAAPDGERLRVVTAHLDVVSTLVRTVLSGNQTRVRQAMGLVDGLARAEEDGYEADATVVGADMNTWAGNESTLRRMRGAFPQSPQWDGLGTRGSFPADHIFFRSDGASAFSVGAYERLADTYSSDHHPRRLTVEYERVE